MNSVSEQLCSWLCDYLYLYDGELDPLHLSVGVELDRRVEFDHSELV